ncbi:hypothetical protein Btru_036422 [Bulinus truncatus]|nr:hypothetical protein Btru_036422 [Bulinus truncatus]
MQQSMEQNEVRRGFLKDMNRGHFTILFNKEIIDKRTEHVRGLEITRKGLLIHYTGLYYIYSSVSFRSDSVTMGETKQLFIHRISLNQPWNSGVLLRSLYTPCAKCANLQESSFTGGIFHLQQGDLIQLCLSSPDNLNLDNSSTSYIGLFMLSSRNP